MGNKNENLPMEAYVALAALRNHGWFLLALSTVSAHQAHYEEKLAEAEEKMRTSEPWSSLILDEWAKGNGNRTESDNAWLESMFTRISGIKGLPGDFARI